MSDAKKLIENLRSLARFEHADLSLGDEAADWIERWAPVVEAAQQFAHSYKTLRTYDASLPNTEHLLIECHVEARKKLLSAALTAFGEDKL